MLIQSKSVAEPFTNLLIDPEHQEVIAKIARKYTRGTSTSWEDAAQTAMMKVYETLNSGKFRQGGITEFQRWAIVVARYEIINFVRKERLRNCQSLDAIIAGTDFSLVDTIAVREQLQIDQELAKFKQSQNTSFNSLFTSFNKTYIILSRWWQNIFEPEWQVFSSFPNLAIATRSHADLQNTHSNPDEIAALVKQLSSDNEENQRQRAAKRLGEIAISHLDAIQALVNLLRSTSDDETLWIAVESLRKIDPENPSGGVRRVKLVDLGMDIAGKAVALAVALLQKYDGNVSVLLQVYPTGSDRYLPPDLKLILLDGSGEILREVTARRADVYTQLKFSCELGERFTVQVALGNANFSEDFVI